MSDDRATKGGGKVTPLLPGIIGRGVAALRYMVEGVGSDTFFGPNQPLPPQAQEAQGRQFDYPVGANINIQPRANEGISFAQLRALADNCDVLRLVIETHKDRLCRMQWKYQAKDEETRGKGKAADPRIKALEDFFRYPDKEHDWPTWYRMILEDLFVIDAPAIYVRKTVGGITSPSQPYALEPIDGATITRKINADGRTPLAPSPAYQQILKGLPAVDYTTDELLYLPRNPRTNKIYGFSPVEQILMTVNVALRRQLHQLEFYTEGNIPDLLIQVPEQWQPDQIKQYQLFWDTLTDTGARRRARFLPNGAAPYDTKQKELKDDFDEWLARVVCFCFSISPQPFVKEVNRATAETATDTAKEEGLEPILDWTARLKNRVIERVFGWTDLEATWKMERELDPKTQAEIDDLDVRNGTATINEVRKLRGREKAENGDTLMIYTGTGPITLEDALAPPEPPPIPAAPAVPGAVLPGTAKPAEPGKEPSPAAKVAERILRLAEIYPPQDDEKSGDYFDRLREIDAMIEPDEDVARLKKKR